MVRSTKCVQLVDEAREMRIRYDFTMDDLMAFARHYAANSPVVRANRRRITIIIGLALFVPAALVATIFPLVGLNMGVVATGLCWLVQRPAVWQRSVEFECKQNYSQPGCNLLGPAELTIEDQGIHSRSANGEMTQFWAAISSIATTETHCFIYLNAIAAFVIPLNNIKEGNVDDFIDEATRRWQAAVSARANAESS